MNRVRITSIFLILVLCSSTVFSACSNSDNATDQPLGDKVAEIKERGTLLLNEPFTHGEIGVLMQKGQENLLQVVNNTIRQIKSDGTLRSLHEKYGLVYVY